MMYTEYFYLEQLYRWLSDVLPIVLIGLVLVVLVLCCVGSIMFESEKGKKENE